MESNNKTLPDIKPLFMKNNRKKSKTRSARQIKKIIRNIKKEPDQALKKLMEKAVTNARTNHSLRSGKHLQKTKINNSIEMFSIYKFQTDLRAASSKGK